MRILLLALFVPFAVHSSTVLSRSQLPFVPAYAADQPELTFESLYGEINQFQQMNAWYSLLGTIESKKFERDLLKAHFEHAVELRRTDAISPHELDRRKFEYEVSAELILELEARAQMIRIQVETSKFNMIMQGDSTKDLRKDMAENMKESLEYQNKAQKHALNISLITESHRKKIVDESSELVRQNIITKVEYATRVYAYEQARNQVKTVRNQISVVNDAITGIDRSLDRLFGRN